MSGDVGKILEVAAVAAAAYFTAGGSLAASGAAADTIGAAGYGGAALGGISDVAGGALYTAPAAAGFGGAATAGTIGAGLAADGATGIGTGLAADGTFSDAGTLAASNVAPALTGTVTSPYSTPATGLIGNVTPASGITNSTALAPTASNPFSSALDWLSGHKGQALGAGKILAAPGLTRAFRHDEDVHRATAAEVFGVESGEVTPEQRRVAKMINFGLMYGMSAHGLAQRLGSPRAEAAGYVQRYFERYPGVKAYMDETRERAKRDGYVETLFGRRLYLDYIHSRNAAQRAGAERAAINAPMQGTAADIIKRAMAAIDQWLGKREDDAHMLMQVHDELVFEVRADAVDHVAKGVRERMQDAAELAVPLLVEVGAGANWNEAH